MIKLSASAPIITAASYRHLALQVIHGASRIICDVLCRGLGDAGRWLQIFDIESQTYNLVHMMLGKHWKSQYGVLMEGLVS